ncbi:MAG: MMPL family transporter [Pseudonocardiales bacterium]
MPGGRHRRPEPVRDRQWLLPLVVLVVAGVALGVAQGVLSLLVSRGRLAMGAEVHAVLVVLVLGTAPGYAMLLIARYRTELRQHPNRFVAMHVAWRASLAPIAASAATVGLGLLCLLVSDLGLSRYLGSVGAIGMAGVLLATITFLPALLALIGRAAFWPRRVDVGSAPAEPGGVWLRVAALVDGRPRLVWMSAAIGLMLLSLGVLRLDASGIPESQQIASGNTESQTVQQVISQHFPAGAGNPAIVIMRAGFADAVAGVARDVAGVATVAPFVGIPPPGAETPEPAVRAGMSRLDVTLDSAPDSAAATDTVRALRAAVHGVSGADAGVGGSTAVQLDVTTTAAQDRIVMPLMLFVLFVLLALLLRALVAPLLLLAAVVLSFLAAVGTSALVFEYIFGFPSVDLTFPLHAFVLLVALGVGYHIVLISRVREESTRHGTRQATLIALVATGGVSTSAGIVLAATFSALALVPLVQLAFTVAFGVLLDTLIVRSLLVPALVIDTDRWFWWPSRHCGLHRLPAPSR